MCEDLTSKELCLVDENMTANIACIHARKMAQTKNNSEVNEGQKELDQVIFNRRQEMAIKDIDVLPSYLDISLNSIHEKFFIKAVHKYVNFFNSTIEFDSLEKRHLRNLGSQLHKIVEQLAYLKHYTMMQQVWHTTTVYYRPDVEHLYAYLTHCFNSKNQPLIDTELRRLADIQDDVIFNVGCY